LAYVHPSGSVEHHVERIIKVAQADARSEVLAEAAILGGIPVRDDHPLLVDHEKIAVDIQRRRTRKRDLAGRGPANADDPLEDSVAVEDSDSSQGGDGDQHAVAVDVQLTQDDIGLVLKDGPGTTKRFMG